MHQTTESRTLILKHCTVLSMQATTMALPMRLRPTSCDLSWNRSRPTLLPLCNTHDHTTLHCQYRSSLIVSRTRLSTVGDRAFPVAAARVWNSLPEHVTSAPSVAVFRSHLKTHLFDISYPDPVWLYSACAVTLVAFGHYDRPCHLLTYLLTECEWLSEWVSSFLTAHYIELPMTSKPLHFCHDAIKYWPTFRTVSPANSAVN